MAGMWCIRSKGNGVALCPLVGTASGNDCLSVRFIILIAMTRSLPIIARGVILAWLSVGLAFITTAAEPALTTKGPSMHDQLILSDAEWQKRLTPEQYQVLRRKGTEAAFCGGYSASQQHGDGVYHCVGCEAPLFISKTKFESDSGWPSFWEPIKDRVASESDRSHGTERTEIHCACCGGHLGHLFDDGPAPTGKRYCINAVSLHFIATNPETAPTRNTEKATFAAGCFWGVQTTFDEVKGVLATRVGYIGGTLEKPTYKAVCTDTTGHAEAIEVTFDPNVVGYQQLLDIFFANHNPTQVNRQGPDEGTQYRSAVFWHSDAQRASAEVTKAKLDASGALKRPVATQIVQASAFWPAEEYHQKYLQKRGQTKCHLP